MWNIYWNYINIINYEHYKYWTLYYQKSVLYEISYIIEKLLFLFVFQ